jgi:tRNA pseudouridine38-40 synthase
MQSIIKTYFKAWEQKDSNLLQSLLSPNFKGIRTVFEELLYTVEDVLFVLDTDREVSYQVLDLKEKNTIAYVDYYATFNGDNEELLSAKFLFEEGKIVSVYESHKLVGKKRVMCRISYDGSTYNGYQKQPNKNTVQDALEDALNKSLKETIVIHSSGRTDKGVHAYNQVIHFDTSSSIPAANLAKVINSYLPDSIYVKEAFDIPETMHSRFDVLSKEYVYRINKVEYDVIMRQYEWYPGLFDTSRFKDELKSIIGTHDFTSLTKTNDLNHVRSIYDVTFVENNKYLYVYIKGNGFLRYMVRNIIASAMKVAKKETNLSLLGIIHKKDNTLIKDIAPAGGLYLNKVEYYD